VSEGSHTPVMLDAVVGVIDPRPGRLIIDATFGAGGYSRAFLAAGARVIAFDRDPAAARFASDLDAERFALVEAPFSAMEAHADAPVDGVAIDLGVSSMQLDEPERGFSFLADGPLDMRMGRSGPTAATLINEAEPAELVRIFRDYGEERNAARIARSIVRRRTSQPFARTLELAETVEQAQGGRRGAKVHPATRVFQALRIAVNGELAELEAGLGAAERMLRGGGRLAVVSFHSLEDRIVKAFLADRSGRTPSGSRHRPSPQPGKPPSFRLLINGVLRPDDAEIARNARARSAKLRAAERTTAPAWSLAA